MIISDEELLQQVWMNIISNAIKFSYENSKIDITLKSHTNFITIDFKDYGCGMDEETIQHIFEKFYQGDKSHSKDGNGLGLALSKKIISICKGDITASKVEDFVGKVIKITGWADAHISTDSKEFDLTYYATDDGYFSTGSKYFKDSLNDYLGDTDTFKILKVKTSKGHTYKVSPIIDGE